MKSKRTFIKIKTPNLKLMKEVKKIKLNFKELVRLLQTIKPYIEFITAIIGLFLLLSNIH